MKDNSLMEDLFHGVDTIYGENKGGCKKGKKNRKKARKSCKKK